MTAASPWRATPDGVELAVRLTPRGGVDRIEGVAIRDGRPWLEVRVAAPPVDDAANAALAAFIARALGVARGQVTIIAGGRGRQKRLHIRGADTERLAALLSVRD